MLLRPSIQTIPWTRIACVGDTDSGSTFGESRGKATIDLDNGENITCTYKNVQKPTTTGSVTIRKIVNGTNKSFAFTGGLGNFSLSNNQTKVDPAFAPGPLTVTETVDPDYTLDSIVCTGDPDFVATSQSAVLKVDAGEVIDCTFTNTIKGALTITKSASPQSFKNVGDVITYTYNVQNGPTAITNLEIHDTKIPVAAITCGTPNLAANGTTTCTGTYTITAADLSAGFVTNVAFATGKDPNPVTSPSVTVTVKRDDDFIRDRTTQVIKNFLYRRADQLLSNEPDRNRLIRRLPGTLWGDLNSQSGQGGSSFTVSGGDGGPTHIAFATSFSQMMADARAARQKKAQEQNDQMMGLGVTQHSSLKDDPLPVWNSGFDVWVEGHYSHFDDDQGNADRSGHLGVMYVGADYLVTPGLLIGALVQFDWMTDTSNVQQTSADGHGWMAGPYMTARLTENLFFDARAAWGQSDNTVNPLGFFVDNFDTDRWLVRANLTGNWNYGNWRFTPSVSVAHIEEEQHAYIDALGISIPGQSVALGRVTFGPEVGYRFFASDGSAIEPMASIQGLWDFEKPDALTIGDQIVSPDTFRGKVEAGVMFYMPVGATVRATANYDGIGSSDFRAYGGQLWVNLPLH